MGVLCLCSDAISEIDPATKRSAARPLLFLCETGAWRMLAGRSSQSASGAMQGKIDRVGSYCPLDLYSGEAAKVSRAFAALLADPQNNLRIFRNGSPLPFRWTPVPE